MAQGSSALTRVGPHRARMLITADADRGGCSARGSRQPGRLSGGPARRVVVPVRRNAAAWSLERSMSSGGFLFSRRSMPLWSEWSPGQRDVGPKLRRRRIAAVLTDRYTWSRLTDGALAWDRGGRKPDFTVSSTPKGHSSIQQLPHSVHGVEPPHSRQM